MKTPLSPLLMLIFAIALPACATVVVSNSSNGEAVGCNVQFVATSTTSTCSKGVSAMDVYVDSNLDKTQGTKLNIQLPLDTGSQKAVVQEWNNCGGSSNTPVDVMVSGGTTLSALQSSGGWNLWGKLPPAYNICSAPCSEVTWSMNQHVKSVSLNK